MTYPSLYVQDNGISIFEASRLLNEKWNYYQAMDKSNCPQINPYCSLVMSVSKSFKQYMSLNESEKNYDDFYRNLNRSLGDQFKDKSIINDYLKRPSLYMKGGENFWNLVEMFETPRIDQKKPFKNKHFFYFGKYPIGQKYHMLQHDFQSAMTHSLCKELGDLAYVGHLKHNFFANIPYSDESFGVIIFGENFYGLLRQDKNLMQSLPAKFDWIDGNVTKGVRYCRYFKTENEVKVKIFEILD